MHAMYNDIVISSVRVQSSMQHYRGVFTRYYNVVLGVSVCIDIEPVIVREILACFLSHLVQD